MKFKNSVGLVLICLLFVMPFALAGESYIVDDELIIKIYNTSKQNYEGISLTSFKIEFISQEDPYNNNKTFSFSVNLSSQDISYESILFDYRVIVANMTVENIDFKEDWQQCTTEKSGYERAWQLCQNNLIKYEGENATICNEELDNCKLTIREKDLDIESKNKEITELGDEKETTKNSKYLWGAIGVVLGILGVLVYRGELGGDKARDKSEGEWNKRQTG